MTVLVKTPESQDEKQHAKAMIQTWIAQTSLGPASETVSALPDLLHD
jgi:hypothetical protein